MAFHSNGDVETTGSAQMQTPKKNYDFCLLKILRKAPVMLMGAEVQKDWEEIT